MSLDIYRGKKVLLTGHTGFKGAWLACWLHTLGAEVMGVALEPEQPDGPFVKADLAGLLDHHVQNICDLEVVKGLVESFRPDVIFHLAAQAIVRESYKNPVATAETNIMGTVNLLEAVRCMARPCSVVVVTSDKCYSNQEWIYPYRENDPMGGHDVYSASKGCTELITAAYRTSFFGGETSGIAVATARAGNVVGPGDWAADRIVPDAVRAFRDGQQLAVRNPNAVRPWQHVLEPLRGYLCLGEALITHGQPYAEGWNFGPRPESAHCVGDLVKAMQQCWAGGKWKAERTASDPHEANYLKLSIDKALARLPWRPVWGFEETVRRTIDGYRTLMQAETADESRAFMRNEISDYVGGC